MAHVVDSYASSNADEDWDMYSGNTEGYGQSFTGDNSVLDTATFNLSKSGSPTGTAVAKVYVHSGTFGTSSVPTGTAFATSGTLDVSTLTTTPTDKTFTFTGSSKVLLSDGIKYVVTVEYTGGNATDKVLVGLDNSTPSHSGNYSYESAGWSSGSGQDVAFSVNGDDVGVNDIEVLDSLEHDTSDGGFESLVQMDSTHFALAYSSSGDDGWIKTFSIDGSYAITEEDSYEFDTNNIRYISAVKLDSTHIAVAYRGLDNDGYITTFSFDGSWVITEEQTLEHDTVYGSYTKNDSMGLLDSTHFALVYNGDTTTNLKTFSVDGSYNITEEDSIGVYDTLDFAIVVLDSSSIAVAYGGADTDGFIKTFSVDGSWDLTLEDTLEFDWSDTDEVALAKIDDTHFALAHSEYGDGHVSIFSVDGSLNITEEDDLQYETVHSNVRGFSLGVFDGKIALAWEASGDGYVTWFTFDDSYNITEQNELIHQIGAMGSPALIYIDAEHFIVAYNGSTSYDGYIKTFKINLPLEASTTMTFGSGFESTTDYYFDGSDAAASDDGSDWSNVTNADDGSTATEASCSASFPGVSSTLKIEGTDAPASGETITQVRARAYSSATSNGNITWSFKTDGASETLGSVLSAVGWSSYDTLDAPSGGWTWAKLQALEVTALLSPAPGGATGEYGRAEIEVTTIAPGSPMDLTPVASADATTTFGSSNADITQTHSATGDTVMTYGSGIESTTDYYFDASDAGPTDSGGDWTDDAQAFDGLTASLAETAIATGAGILSGEGTTAPASGSTLVLVRARVYYDDQGTFTNTDFDVYFREDTAESGTLLGSLLNLDSGVAEGWSSYVTLSAPSGGWTWAKVQSLAVDFDATYTDNDYIQVYKAEIEVTTNSGTELTLIPGSSGSTTMTFGSSQADAGLSLQVITASDDMTYSETADLNQTHFVDASTTMTFSSTSADAAHLHLIASADLFEFSSTPYLSQGFPLAASITVTYSDETAFGFPIDAGTASTAYAMATSGNAVYGYHESAPTFGGEYIEAPTTASGELETVDSTSSGEFTRVD